jgi:hypothetical protein
MAQVLGRLLMFRRLTNPAHRLLEPNLRMDAARAVLSSHCKPSKVEKGHPA